MVHTIVVHTIMVHTIVVHTIVVISFNVFNCQLFVKYLELRIIIRIDKSQKPKNTFIHVYEAWN
jgi:hypothetical protein